MIHFLPVGHADSHEKADAVEVIHIRACVGQSIDSSWIGVCIRIVQESYRCTDAIISDKTDKKMCEVIYIIISFLTGQVGTKLLNSNEEEDQMTLCILRVYWHLRIFSALSEQLKSTATGTTGASADHHIELTLGTEEVKDVLETCDKLVKAGSRWSLGTRC